MCVKKKSGCRAIRTELQLYIKFTVYFIFFLRYILQPERLKFISLRKQRGELNCLELNNTGHLGAAELFCRLEGWTVQCTLPPNALSIDLSRNYSSPQKPTQSVQRSAPRHPPLQRCIFTLRNLEKVQLWMHPPTSINDRAGPPDPPLLANKVLLRLGGFPGSLVGLVQTSTQVCFHCLFSKIDFQRNTYLVAQQSSRVNYCRQFYSVPEFIIITICSI